MKTIYTVVMGALNSGSRFTFSFSNLEDAEKMRDALDKGKGASAEFSEIYFHGLYESLDEVLTKI